MMNAEKSRQLRGGKQNKLRSDDNYVIFDIKYHTFIIKINNFINLAVIVKFKLDLQCSNAPIKNPTYERTKATSSQSPARKPGT